MANTYKWHKMGYFKVREKTCFWGSNEQHYLHTEILLFRKKYSAVRNEWMNVFVTLYYLNIHEPPYRIKIVWQNVKGEPITHYIGTFRKEG